MLLFQASEIYEQLNEKAFKIIDLEDDINRRSKQIRDLEHKMAEVVSLFAESPS